MSRHSFSPQSPPTSHRAPRLRDLLPSGFGDLLGPKPIIWGEPSRRYDRLLAQLIFDYHPMDFTGYFLVKLIADATWELQRITRFEIDRIKRTIPEAADIRMPALLMTYSAAEDRRAPGWARRTAEHAIVNDQEDVEQLNSALGEVGLTHDDLAATVYAHRLERLRQFQDMRMALEDKIERFQRQIERHKLAAGQIMAKTRQAETIEVEVEDLSPSRAASARSTDKTPVG